MTITVPEAGRRLGVSRSEAWRMVRAGTLPAYRLPGDRTWYRVDARAVDRLLLSVQSGGAEVRPA